MRLGESEKTNYDLNRVCLKSETKKFLYAMTTANQTRD